MADGYLLPLSVWRPPDDVAVRAVVLALHGLNDYRQAFAAVGPYLAAHGIVTYAYDQRGFGETQAAGCGMAAGASPKTCAPWSSCYAAPTPADPYMP